MPYQIPTVAELVDRTARAFRANLKGSDARLWPNNVAVSAKVIAGAVWLPYTFIEYISRQILVHTAEGQWLDRHAYDWGMARLAATAASGYVTITGDANIPVPAGIVLQRGDGVEYEVTAPGVTLGNGTAVVPVRALSAGRAGNTAAGVIMTMMAAIDRLQAETVVTTAGIGLGNDTESDESLRARVLFRKRMPPHGGAAHDYVAWCREINGVTRVFVDPVTAANGRSTVGVWFLMDDLYLNGIPLQSDVARVASYIEDLRPAGAVVDVRAPVPIPVDVVITGLSPDTVTVRDAVRAEIAAMFRREARVSTKSEPFRLWRSMVSEAVSIAVGEQHHILSNPATDIAFTPGQIPVLGQISFYSA